jgi:GntR family transcriptional regulator / MocR family aminotransferase
MAKQSSPISFMLPERKAGMPAYRWLYAALRAQILSGTLCPGTQLPATREFASQYGLSRGTIVSAFDELKSEGYVEGSIGSGTYVSKVLPEELLQVTVEAGAREASRRKISRRVSEYARRVRLFSNLQVRPTRAFRANLPALDLFPAALWAQTTARRLRRASTNLLLACGPLGYMPLREAVAHYLNTSRGVRCVPEQVAIVSGVQEALDLAARLFLNPGDKVCMENPGYPGAAMAFEAVGAKVSAISLDEEGMALRERALRGARLVYLTPGHQFPMGITMSLPRRLALLEWARKSGALIFEDDYDSEYRYAGRPVPAMQGLDRHGLVLFAGSFSKVLFPSIRLGYLVVPSDLVDYVAATLSVTTRHAPLLEQAVLCDFIVDGHFGRHLRRMREIYAERFSALGEGVRTHLAGLLEISGVEAGLQTAALLREGMSGELAAQTAAKRGVDSISLHWYNRGKVEKQGLQLGFAAVDTREIRRGVRALAIALEELDKNISADA